MYGRYPWRKPDNSWRWVETIVTARCPCTANRSPRVPSSSAGRSTQPTTRGTNNERLGRRLSRITRHRPARRQSRIQRRRHHGIIWSAAWIRSWSSYRTVHIALDAEDRVLVCDSGNRRVLLLDSKLQISSRSNRSVVIRRWLRAAAFVVHRRTATLFVDLSLDSSSSTNSTKSGQLFTLRFLAQSEIKWSPILFRPIQLWLATQVLTLQITLEIICKCKLHFNH